MKNRSLALDYLQRSEKRLLAIDTLYEHESWADVVRQSQEIVELCLKGLLRFSNIEVPRIHDVGSILKENQSLIAKELQPQIEKLADISHHLRRDRELAFYGSEDLTPSEFYNEKEAKKARENARWVVKVIGKVLQP